MAATARPPFKGTRRKIVLAFDIGTTFSGISYSILDPGEIPEIRGVTRYPCQEHVGGDSKIPTIIYYDKKGNVRAVGAEAVKEGLEEIFEDEGWEKAEWFKLHLRPKSSANDGTHDKIPPLPKNKTVIDLFTDFMKYLYICAREYIRDTHANGADIWASIESQDGIDFVLTHPNGWEGAQQAQMRRAAVRAGLVPNTNAGRSRIQFVTEGEASLHFCILNGLATSAMEKGEGVLIVDAGGGTIDLSAYGRNSTTAGSSFREIATPQCFFQGSVFVTRNAQSFLETILKGSKFQEDIGHIANIFDKTTKLRFRNREEAQYIRFGTARDKDPQLGIRAGQLRLNGADVARFFEPSVNSIVKAILDQRRISQLPISSVFLVGGFAASDWLFSQIKQSLEPLGVAFCRPDSHVNKAVADGGVSYYVDHVVTERISRYAYGVECCVIFSRNDKEHVKRGKNIYLDLSGEVRIPGRFNTILAKGVHVTETKEFRSSYSRFYRTPFDFPNQVREEIICYTGTSIFPRWIDEDQDNYPTLCRVIFDGKEIKKSLLAARAADSTAYYHLKFDIVLNFGLTELTAQVCWVQNGREQRSPAEIVYDRDVIEALVDPDP